MKAAFYWGVAVFIVAVLFGFLLSTATSPPPAQSARPDPEKIKASALWGLSFASLAREPDKYKGRMVALRGQVIQVLENGQDLTLRVNVTKQERLNIWDDTMLVTYRRSSSQEKRVLEKDMITFYGPYRGVTQYKSILGQTISAPLVAAAVIENESAGSSAGTAHQSRSTNEDAQCLKPDGTPEPCESRRGR